jgi:hypothetical protein
VGRVSRATHGRLVPGRHTRIFSSPAGGVGSLEVSTKSVEIATQRTGNYGHHLERAPRKAAMSFQRALHRRRGFDPAVAWGRTRAAQHVFGVYTRGVVGRCVGGPVFRAARLWHHARAHHRLCVLRCDAHSHARYVTKIMATVALHTSRRKTSTSGAHGDAILVLPHTKVTITPSSPRSVMTSRTTSSARSRYVERTTRPWRRTSLDVSVWGCAPKFSTTRNRFSASDRM